MTHSHATTRRDLIKLGALGAAAALGTQWASAADAPAGRAGMVQEPAREVPIAGEADVIVCGGGPAGVAAAVAAARKGARTLLLEVHGCLGGVWTAGALSLILDHANKAGIMREIIKMLGDRQGQAITRKGFATSVYDVEVMKFLLDDLCAEAGVQVHLHTRICAALRGADGRLSAAITESKSGREAFTGKVFIDCTGDGDLATLAGCGYDMGHPETGRLQPMSLMAILTGISPDDMAPYFLEQGDGGGAWAPPKDRLRAEMERGGHSPSYSKPTLFRVRDDLFALMANHEYGVKGTDARDLTRATLHARRELHNLIDGLRSLGGIWKNIRIVATGQQIGVREGRRIRGLYTVTQDDLRDGREHKDAVCRVTFPIDVHSTDAKKEKGIEAAGFRAKPYDIPLRALIAKDVQGLMMAGRCISGDFIAHSSYRVTGNAVAMGEAAGKTAAIAAKTSRLPQAVEIREIG